METIIKPHFYIVLLDETQIWVEETVKKCGGGIKGAYFFDANMQIHCCEITPSYELYFIESIPALQPEDDCEADELENELREANKDSYQVSYVHCHNINPKDCIEVWDFTNEQWEIILDNNDGNVEKAHAEAIENCREYIGQNMDYVVGGSSPLTTKEIR